MAYTKRECQKYLIVVLIIFHYTLKNIFKDNELNENSVIEDSSITASKMAKI